MLTINITQFTGYTADDILDYLLIHQPPILDVILPKESDNTVPGLIPVEFCRAAYAGQLLHNLSSDFFHSIPDPETKGCFSFIMVTTDFEAVAPLLYTLMAVFTGLCDNDEDVQLDCDAADFFASLSNTEELACPAYLDIMNQYS